MNCTNLFLVTSCIEHGDSVSLSGCWKSRKQSRRVGSQEELADELERQHEPLAKILPGSSNVYCTQCDSLRGPLKLKWILS